ncbi:MAG: SurA N-terminal domain-containing protein [Thermodesulfobacteriota bacterium]|nr:SurA N-terminal domain-containing protein [Thermodesulfobacteriota bacterium]
MLELMRRNARSWFIQAALFAVIVVFVFWGVGSFKPDSSNRIATVNDYRITMNEYRKAYDNILKRYKEIYKEDFSEETIERLNLKEMTINSLIEKVLLLQEAEKLNLEVTDDELKKSIIHYPVFQKDGVFKNSLYKQLLRYNRITPEEFEDLQRKEILQKKVENLIKDNAKVSDKELLDAYTLENESINIEVTHIKHSAFKGSVKISDEEISDYFSNNKRNYQIPAKVNVQYLNFNPKDYESQVTLLAEEINDYYELNIDKFSIPAKIKAKHILIAAPQDDAESRTQGKQKAEMILKKIHNGADFSALAKKYSDDPSAKKGGDLGFVERDKLMPSIKEALSSIQEGEISSIVYSPFGFHIIKAEKILDARTMPLSEVESEIHTLLKLEKADELAQEEAENINALTIDTKDLNELALTENLKIKKTGLFASGENIEGIGRDRTFSNAAFLLEKGEISQIVKSSGTNYILQAIEKLPPQIPELEKVKTEVKKDLIFEKEKSMAKAKAENLLKELKEGKEWESIIRENKLKSEQTGFFKRRGRIGYSEEVKEHAFSLSKNTPYSDRIFEANDNYIILRFKDRKGIDKEEFSAAKKRLKKLLLQQKREDTFRLWMDGIKAKAEIKLDMSVIR